MVEKTFHEMEQEAWSERAAQYDDVFAPVSTQAVGGILDSLGYLKGKRLLDVACGTGHLVAAASARGAVSEGVDFAEPMVEIARSTYPRANFNVADATCLPFDDASFDAVTCAFGLLHMESPQEAIDEAFRVLRPGGRFAFTLWYGAEDGNEIKQIVQSALKKHAVGLRTLPPHWTQLRDADPQVCEKITRLSGFAAPVFERLPIVWKAEAAADHLETIEKLSVRTKMIIDDQPPNVRHEIYNQIRAEIESRRSNGLISLAWPALLTVVQKPGD